VCNDRYREASYLSNRHAQHARIEHANPVVRKRAHGILTPSTRALNTHIPWYARARGILRLRARRLTHRQSDCGIGSPMDAILPEFVSAGRGPGSTFGAHAPRHAWNSGSWRRAGPRGITWPRQRGGGGQPGRREHLRLSSRIHPPTGSPLNHGGAPFFLRGGGARCPPPPPVLGSGAHFWGGGQQAAIFPPPPPVMGSGAHAFGGGQHPTPPTSNSGGAASSHVPAATTGDGQRSTRLGGWAAPDSADEQQRRGSFSRRWRNAKRIPGVGARRRGAPR